MNKRTVTRAGAFTLIEMLLVVTIIAILAGLLLGGINMAIKKAEMNKAQTTVFQLATAFRAYQGEYGTWPAGLANPGSITGSVLNILTGVDTTANPRRHAFYEPDSKSLKNGNYFDPWGNNYQYKYDSTYMGGVVMDGKTSTAGVVVWSYGPKGTTGPTNDWLKTW